MRVLGSCTKPMPRTVFPLRKGRSNIRVGISVPRITNRIRDHRVGKQTTKLGNNKLDGSIGSLRFWKTVDILVNFAALVVGITGSRDIQLLVERGRQKLGSAQTRSVSHHSERRVREIGPPCKS